MAITDIIFGGPKRLTIGIVQFDASVDETHVTASEATTHPVETGGEVSDHIRRLPTEITITGQVTDTPIVYLASTNARSPLTTSNAQDRNRVDTAYAELRRAQADGELVTVATSLIDYTNMAILSISVTRNAKKGKILEATINLREILITNSQSVDLPSPKKVVNNTKKDKGKKNKKNGKTKQQSKSLAVKLASQLLGS